MPLSPLESRLCKAVASRAGALLSDLEAFVNIPTGHNHKPGLDRTRGLLCERLAALGAACREEPGAPRPDWLYSPTVSGMAGGSAGAGFVPPPTAICERVREGVPRVLIAGHLDTVHDPAGPFRTLSIEPGGKRATGPGCVDMKGGLVIAVHALEALEDCGVDASWSFITNSDEETGSFCSDRALREAAKHHEFGIALEPALPGGELAIERVGSGQFVIDVRGRSAHVGRDFRTGVSAVSALVRALAEIDGMSRFHESGDLIFSVGPVRGNDAPNAVPDTARAWGNVRFSTPALAEEAGRMLGGLEVSADPMTDGRASVRALREFSRPPKPLTPETEALALRARAAAEDLGQRLPFMKTGGVCDGNNLQAAGLSTIDTLGVRGGGLHTPDEWIEIPSLVERCQMLAVLIARLCGNE